MAYSPPDAGSAGRRLDVLRRLRVLRRHRLSPATYQWITKATVWALGFIIVTGAAVRLTGSGLGCTNWPDCSSGHIIAPWQYHAWIEFGNRLVTGLVSVAIVAAVLGSGFRAPRRRDLDLLSWGLVAGLMAQIVLGGETVRHDLAPQFVMSHFMLSLLLLADALVLHHRSAIPDGSLVPSRGGRGRRARPQASSAMVSPEQVALCRLLIVTAGIVVFLGTIVTSTGPHGGSPKAKRFGFSLHDVAKLHASSVWLYLFFVVATLWSLMRSGAASSVVKRGEVLLVVVVVQGAIGYLQYFTGVPAALVELHVLGATLVWAATIWFNLGLFTSTVPAEPAPARLLAEAT
jgi:cytochrome c oxidase assembly protein subunit 15